MSIASHRRNGRKLPMLVAACLLVGQCFPGPARAENQMGYQLLTPQAAAGLPRNRGSLGLDVERSQQITDGGMTFDIIRVKGVHRGSPGAQAGFAPGDQIIAVDGQVFANLAAFAAYVGSVKPGRTVSVDYIPKNGGPAQAQRASVAVGTAGGGAQQSAQSSAPGGMSTGTKVAIGVGAAALFGCYEMGCFSHRRPAQTNTSGQQPYPQPGAYQQQIRLPAAMNPGSEPKAGPIHDSHFAMAVQLAPPWDRGGARAPEYPCRGTGQVLETSCRK